MTREQVLGLVDRLKGATELSDAPVTLARSEAVMLTRVLEELHQANWSGSATETTTYKDLR